MKRFQSFRLDTANQCLWHGEVRVVLTPKVFGVLCYLVEHAGRLVTQEELLQAIWPDTYVNPEVLRKYVQGIRKALGDRPDKPAFIETLPKRGYQFVASVIDEDTAGALPPGGTKAIVGRASESAELKTYLTRTRHNERQVVFVTGEPGVGKTALVDEFQHHARLDAPDVRVVRGQCVEGYGGKEAYYPMLEAVSQLCGASGGEKVVQILSAQAPTWLVQFPALTKREQREALQREILGATRERMLREISEALETIASERPLLLVLEDLHWVDHFTVDLISVLARRRQAAKLMLIGTFRPVDLVLSDHPLKALKRDLLIHRLCHEIALQPLEESEVTDFLTAKSGAVVVPEGLGELIYRFSEGNPLFMVAALEHMRERKFITQENDKLTLTVSLKQIELRAPENLRQMIEVQIERLTEEEQQALEVASVIGVSFSSAISAPAAKMDVDEFEELCDGLSLRHKIVRSADPLQFPDGTTAGRYEFVHALYREELYHRQSHRRRARLHLQVGERLEALYRNRPGEAASELADHFEQGEDWPRAVKYLLLAADTAGRRFEPRQAAEILEHALGLTKRLPDAEMADHEIAVLEKLATMYIPLLDPRIFETCESLAARAAQSGLVDIEVNTLLKMAWPLLLMNSDQCLKVMHRALQLSTDCKDKLLHARTVMTWSLFNVFAGDWNAKHAEDCRRAFDVIRERANRLLLGSSLMDYSFIQWCSSEYRAGYQNAIAGLATIMQEIEINPYLSDAHQRQMIVPWCLLYMGEWGEALQAIDAAVAMVNRNSDYQQGQTIRLNGAWVHLHALDFSGVQKICEMVLEHDRNVEVNKSDARFCSILLASAEVNLGNYERAHALLSSVREEMDHLTVVLDWYRRILMESVLTEFWLAKGELGQARIQAESFLKTVLATEERTWRTLAWEANARVAMAELDFMRAQECIAKGLTTMEGFEVPLAAWQLHATACELYQIRDEPDLAERHRELSCTTIIQLANSLPAEEPLRQVFLSAPMVRKILDAGEAPELRAIEALT